MNWDSKYVRSTYGASFGGVEYIFYPATSAKRLIVLFSSMGSDRFDRYSWFWSDDENWAETAYLFIKDDSFCYFIGTDDRPMTQTVRKLISQKLETMQLTPSSLFTVGGSMGGYAAVYYACLLCANSAIVSNAQFDYLSARSHKYQNWERQIRATGSQWVDLPEYVHRFDRVPNLYIEYGEYRADWLAAEKLIASLRDYPESLLILRKFDWREHTVNSLSKTTIETAVSFFENHGFREQI